ncbi:MAG: guanylate kinase [Candidatus Margulisbacteria bacterium]|nr:guanylate kinase [Candidatus Margulisiibacteriota bacterium]
MKKGQLIIISGPSGVGKGTIIQELLKLVPNLHLAISATTRKPRKNETNKNDYYFLSDVEFSTRIEKGDFLEWVIFQDHKYGTLTSEVTKWVQKGHNVILEIDTKGAKKVQDLEEFSHELVSIFIMPPTFEDLYNRLHGRQTNLKEDIDSRLHMAGKELAAIGQYGYIVVNKSVSDAANEIISIIEKE